MAAFSSAQTRSLIGVSANDNAQSESIRTATWNNTGNFYVRVAGRNGASSPNPFHLALSTLGGPCSTVALKSFSDQQTLTGMAGSAQTVVLTDTSRIGQGTGAGLQTALSALAGKTGGAVVDVSTSPRIVALNQQADANTACPFAKNLVAQAIRDVVNSYRDSRGTLKYVVVAGGDSVIPFFRYADSAGIGPESNYVPPVRDTTASQASLRDNYVLGQDAYGSLTDVTLKGAVLPVPDLAVGRLVETPDEIQGMVNAFLALPNGVLPTPTSSLVTGYDFLTSAADTVQSDFSAGIGTTGHADSLITNQGVPTTTTTVDGTTSRSTSWTATDLSKALLSAHHDLVFLAGHFSANNTLAADYSSTLATTDLDAHQGLLTNSLVLSAGCHAGYNLLDADGVPDVTLGLDWAQEMARQKATFVAGTGYQYADTDFLAYSAKIYAGLADGLLAGTGPVGIGPALVGAKQAYLAAATTVTGIDQKALIEMTLYGLPMTALNLPHGRTAAPVTPAGITPAPVTGGTPGDALGLKTAPLDLTPHLTPASKAVLDLNGNPTGASFHWLVGDGGVHSAPGLPALPQQSGDVTSTTGEVLRGVGFVSGTYTDTPGVTPLTGAPTTEQNGVHTSFASSVFFPQKLATVNYFDALGGSAAAGRTRLITTPAQYRSDPGSMSTDTERAYSHVGLQLFYSANTKTYGSNTPALAAPPSISGVSDTGPLDGSAVTLRAHVTGDPSAGVQEAWVTYTAESGPLHGQWQSVNLVQDQTDSTLWTSTFPLPVGQDISAVRYIVQAVNGVGLVGLDNNLGDGYTPRVPVGVATAPGTTPTSLTLGSAPASGVSGASLDVSATLTGVSQASPVTFSLGSTSITSNTNAGGLATATLPLEDAVGGYTLTALYGGDATYRSSTTSTPFSITKTATSLALSASGPANPIVATLSRTAGAVPLPQQTVFFTLTGPGPGLVTKVLTAATDPQGRAQVTAPALPDGVYSVVAGFLGTPSTYMSSSSSSVSIVVDTRAPTVTAVLSPPANLNGWNNAAVTVSWLVDDSTANVPATVTVSGGGANQIVTSAASCDLAGNCAKGSATVSVDLVGPLVVGSQSPQANGAGWSNASVSVSWSCSDALSGVATCPVSSMLGEGAHQVVSGVALDVAGNSTTVLAGPINVDVTAPLLAGHPVTSPNGVGWFKGDVMVRWSCSDVLSGVLACPPDSTVGGEGVGLNASADVVDVAGNRTHGLSDTVQIDRTAPVTSVGAFPAWSNTDLFVGFHPSDNLSGVAATFYSVDGGSTQTGLAAYVSGTGSHTVLFWSVDVAGNTETAHTVTVRIDKTAPTISHALSPLPNGNGWNNADVTVTFTCGSGVSGIASCTSPVTVTGEGRAQAVTGTAVNNAGTSASDTAFVSLDRTAPMIAGSTTRLANSRQWFNAPVTVRFTCTDMLSGVSSCTNDVTVTTEGSGQVVSGNATDAAGNTAAATVSGINIDVTAPAITGQATVAANAAGWFHGPVTIHWTCTDSGSRVGSCPGDTIKSTDGFAQQVTGVAVDNAGNQTTGTVTGINIDQFAPTVTVTGIANGATYPLSSVPTAGCSSSDTLSGVATASTVSSTRQGNGVYNVSCSAATDNAGNASAPVSASYTVTVDATSLASLTSAYITANHNSGAAWVSNNWNGKIQKLSNDLKTGKVCKFITDTQTEIGSTLTQTQANDLNYWAHLIDPTCKPL